MYTYRGHQELDRYSDPVLMLILSLICFSIWKPWTLKFDFENKSYVLRSGYWPFVKTRNENVEQFYAVSLFKYNSIKPYVVSVILPRRRLPLVVFQSSKREDATKLGLQLASEIGVPCLIRTRWRNGKWSDGEIYSVDTTPSRYF